MLGMLWGGESEWVGLGGGVVGLRPHTKKTVWWGGVQKPPQNKGTGFPDPPPPNSAVAVGLGWGGAEAPPPKDSGVGWGGGGVGRRPHPQKTVGLGGQGLKKRVSIISTRTVIVTYRPNIYTFF